MNAWWHRGSERAYRLEDPAFDSVSDFLIFYLIFLFLLLYDILFEKKLLNKVHLSAVRNICLYFLTFKHGNFLRVISFDIIHDTYLIIFSKKKKQ